MPAGWGRHPNPEKNVSTYVSKHSRHHHYGKNSLIGGLRLSCLVTTKFLTTSPYIVSVSCNSIPTPILATATATATATTMATTGEPKPEASKMTPIKPTTVSNLFLADLALRFFLFATTLVSLVLMVTSKQTKVMRTPFYPLPVITYAKFNYSPALIYFVVAISVALFHSLLTGLVSAISICKTAPPAQLLLALAFLDSLILGVVASATGAVASIAYIGLKGNSHVFWNKICNDFDKFCRYVGSSVIISLVASIILVLLVMISTYSLYQRSK